MINLITVVFKQELSYLKMQAKSIELYVNSQDLNSIVIVVNDSIDILASIDPLWYGINSHKVKILHFSELISESDLSAFVSQSGWDTQQICKLLAASISNVDWNMIIDAKTLFICPLVLTNLITLDNKAFSNPAEISHHFIAERDFVQQYFNINLNNHYIGPGGVPFLMHSSTVRSLIEYIKMHENISLTEFFFRYSVTEFLLYSGYVLFLFKKYNALYQIHHPDKYIYHHIADSQILEFDLIMQFIHQHANTITISLHRRAYPLLTDKQKTCWCELLYSKKLIDSVEDTKNELNTILAG